MRFSTWLKNRLLTEGRKKRGSRPVQMPKPESNAVKPAKIPKQRQRKGIQDTSFRPRPEARGLVNKRAIEEQ